MKNTIEERLKQIEDIGLPHVFVPGEEYRNLNFGNSLPIAKHLEGSIPEVVVPRNLNVDLLKSIFNSKDEIEYVQNFIEYAINCFPPTELNSEDFGNGKGRGIEWNSYEMRAFYNQQGGGTHYFILPSKELRDNKSK